MVSQHIIPQSSDADIGHCDKYCGVFWKAPIMDRTPPRCHPWPSRQWRRSPCCEWRCYLDGWTHESLSDVEMCLLCGARDPDTACFSPCNQRHSATCRARQIVLLL